MKIVNIDKGKPLYLPNDLRNFNKTFRKDVSYDNIKSHKKQGFTLSMKHAFLEKPQGLFKLTP